MAKGQIATPEFYLDYMLWLNTVGSLDYNNLEYDNAFTEELAGVELISSMLRLDPSVAAPIPTNEYAAAVNSFTIPTGLSAGFFNDLGEDISGEPDMTDFNNWNIHANPMKKLKDGDYSIELDLELGREYQFRYLIDQLEWENDRSADKYVRSDYGDCDNSVVIVDALG